MTQTNGIGTSSQLIGTTLGQTEKTSQADRAKSTAEAATKQSSVTQTGTTATLSGTGSLLAAAANTDDVRTEKVAALKAAIDSGTYNVSAEKVADKLIDTMLG